MIAKVPARREDGKSNFKRLVEYIIHRDELKDDLINEIDPGERKGRNRIRQSDRSDTIDSQGFHDQAEHELLGRATRLITSTGVAIEHNCLRLESASVEMEAVAAQNCRVKDPVYHCVISWPSEEAPTDAQAFDCASYALATLGMTGHQYVFAVHRDTSNVHIHVAVNRVHPDTFGAVYPDRDYFRLDCAMRELELRYGWKHDIGPYAVFERNGETVIDWSSKALNTKGKRPSSASDMERHGDQESLFSYVRREPRRAFLDALNNEELSWPQIHNLMGKYGLELREKGQGFAVYDKYSTDITPVKASDMHEELSKTRLIKRIGEYQPPRSVLESISKYDKHLEPKRDQLHREQRRQERALARRILRNRYSEYKNGFVYQRLALSEVKEGYARLRDDARRRRQEVRESVSDPVARKALYSVIAFESLRAREHMRREVRNNRDTLRNDPSNRRKPFREWVEHQAAAGDAAAISQLRGFVYADKRQAKELGRSQSDTSRNGIVHSDDVDPIARNLPGLYYRVRRDGSVIYRTEEGRNGFIDNGRRIDVLANTLTDREIVAAALSLAKEKYEGAFELTGSEAFKRQAIEIMVEYKVDAHLIGNDQAALKQLRSGKGWISGIKPSK